ncbi:hypothetical protein [Synechococcus sp. MIT S9504]|uniref:hypothetical protein n=1 Tax=Synechococcus sp. MIT S9504 TaxID=1801628 RepID=UPI0018D337FE|nr:hypothetical protein [Synechococcus sp. MIT S9504]
MGLSQSSRFQLGGLWILICNVLNGLVVASSRMPMADSHLTLPGGAVALSLYLFVLGWASGGTSLYR